MSIITRHFYNETAIIENSFMRIPALRELAAIVPILLIVGIGYRQILIIALIILGLATANRGITTNQKPILADHVSVILFLSLISLTWVLVLESHTLVRNIVVGVIIATIFCLLGRGISLLAHETDDATGRNTSTSDILHWSLVSSIAVTALGWSSLFYYSLALVLVAVTQRWIKEGIKHALSLALVGLGSIASWSVRRQNEGQILAVLRPAFSLIACRGITQMGTKRLCGRRRYFILIPLVR